jgi:hypothetical protein
MRKLTLELRSEIASAVEGTCMTVGAMVERYDLDISDDDLEDELLTAGIECCPGCGWWMESCELVDEDGEAGACDQCREVPEE